MKTIFKFLPSAVLALAGLALVAFALFSTDDESWRPAEAVIVNSEVFGTGSGDGPAAGFVRVNFRFNAGGRELSVFPSSIRARSPI